MLAASFLIFCTNTGNKWKHLTWQHNLPASTIKNITNQNFTYLIPLNFTKALM